MNSYTIRHYKRGPAIERFLDKIEVGPENECWNWTSTTAGSNARYGTFGPGGSAGKVYAHRWSYQFFKGIIPAGKEIDHLCKNKLCVNPDHLEAVTHRENSNRVEWDSEKMRRPNTSRNLLGVYCKAGDETLENLKPSRDSLGRYCKKGQ